MFLPAEMPPEAVEAGMKNSQLILEFTLPFSAKHPFLKLASGGHLLLQLP